MKTTDADIPVVVPVVDARLDDDSTRQRVMQSILEHGPSTAAQLAERLEVTTAAIRRHLSVLTETGDVEPRDQRVQGQRGRGRPAKVFALTDSGRSTFRHEYDQLAIEALRALASAIGPSALGHLVEQRFAVVEQRYLAGREADPERSPVEVLAEALDDDGYVASTRPAHAGEQLCQHHCPVSQVAAEFPELCEAETRLFSRLLGSHVQRLATIAHGDGVCTTHVPQLVTLEPPKPMRGHA